MSGTLGSGKDVLTRKIQACMDAGGIPQFATAFGGKQFSNTVIFSCWGCGDKVGGGKIEHLPRNVVQFIRKRQKLTEKQLLDGNKLLEKIKEF